MFKRKPGAHKIAFRARRSGLSRNGPQAHNSCNVCVIVISEYRLLLLFQVDLKFQAPYKAKSYHYTVTIRSDSYLDFDVHQNFNVSNFFPSCFETEDYLMRASYVWIPQTKHCFT